MTKFSVIISVSVVSVSDTTRVRNQDTPNQRSVRAPKLITTSAVNDIGF